MTASDADTNYSREQQTLTQAGPQDPEKILGSSLLRLHQQYPVCRKLVVALSGGLDSTALLEACVALQQAGGLPFEGLRVIHVNHGINSNADDWETHCRSWCQYRQVEFYAQRVLVNRDAGDSLEAVAREARYAVFEQQLNADEALLLAHHLDDQAETVLLRLLRGAGSRGLAGMPRSRPLGQGVLWRPWLATSRKQIERWAQQRSLRWVEDGSNTDLTLSRNYLRHQVLPLVAGHWPGWQQSISQSAELSADADEILQVFAERELAALGATDGAPLPCGPVLAMTAACQRLLIRQWLSRQVGETPGRRLIQRVRQEMLGAAEDAQPQILWHHHVLRRYRGALYVTEQLEALPVGAHISYPWQSQADGRFVALVLPGNGSLRLYRAPAPGVMRLPQGKCEIRYRQGGERCALAGRPRRALKKILQESAVPPWLRERTPLLYIDGKLAWIVGVGVCEGFQLADDETGWAVSWQMASRQDHI